MAEQLSLLMHEEVDGLDVPAPSTPLILDRGRQMRSRRAQVRAAGFVGLVIVVAAGLLGLRHGSEERRLDGDLRIADASRAMAAYTSEGGYAIGDELVLGANRFEWHEPIKALHYTAAGVVIQSGKNPDRDEGGSNYALVTPTGEWSTIDVALDDQMVGFETSSTRFAYAEPVGDGFDLVIHDAASDEEVARTSIELGTTTIGWRAPPAAIHGDAAWVRGDEGWQSWNWRTGAIESVPGTTDTYEVAGGVYADWAGEEQWLIRSTETSDLLRELDLREGWYGFFSPDGAYLRSFPNRQGEESSVDFEFFSVATGETWQVENVVDTYERVDFGWSPDGHVLQLLDDTLSVCDPDTGACEVRATGIGGGAVRLGGEPYGS